MSTKLVVVVEGGLVRNILADGPAEVVVIDHDVERTDTERQVRLEDVDGTHFNVYAYIERPLVRKRWVRKTFKEVSE